MSARKELSPKRGLTNPSRPSTLRCSNCFTTLLCFTHKVISKTKKVNCLKRKTQKDGPAYKTKENASLSPEGASENATCSSPAALSDVLGDAFLSRVVRI
jgi:hypothetical protein